MCGGSYYIEHCYMLPSRCKDILEYDIIGDKKKNLNQLYEMEKSLLIVAILKYNLRNESDEENLSEPSSSTKESAKENTSMPSP